MFSIQPDEGSWEKGEQAGREKEELEEILTVQSVLKLASELFLLSLRKHRSVKCWDVRGNLPAL